MLKKFLITSMLVACVFVAMDSTLPTHSDQESEESQNLLSCGKKNSKDSKETEETLAACTRCRGGCRHRA